ncbi:lysosomal pro-X carboxypeptidase, putative [Ricinus communis]|uniref:Lysosomal pro-X carboxypeptidase, putative n=1 Tax=Ricinus communis TaxID=3988 RepID=B9SX74_RICCO|nr:lysosomal pro-X carboxypeptidase, putative [Ricinus communis]
MKPEQALADFAVLITDLKRNLTAEDCPVVLFGGSYGGMLAAWMRLKYPHIAIGALAASAPILQFENVVPHEIFYDIVSNDFKRESSRCFNTIKESWNAIASEGLKENGLVKLSRTFHMCSDLNSTDELADWLESAYSYLAMVDYPYPAEFMMPLPGHPIREVTFYFSTSKLSHIVYPCLHILDFRNWCSEMVMPMASSKYESMFPTYDFNYTSFEKQCWDDFRVVSRPRWIMTEFGGQDIKTSLEKFGSNIIFSNGLLDPWSGGSVLQNISDTVVALVTEEGAHHIDLRPSTPEDPDWLVEQRATEVKLIEGWINDHNQKKRATFDM